MSTKNKWSFLQLFAGEGAGAGSAGGTAGDAGAGAATPGVGTVDAAQRLRDLGVPESKISRYNRAKPSTARQQEVKAPAPGTQQAAAAKEEDAQAEQPHDQPKKFDWDEVMKDPECNRRMQETVQASKRKSKAAEEALEALSPALKAYAKEHGLDAENLDYTSIAKAMTGQYEQMANESGLPTDAVVKMDQQQRTIEQQRNELHIQKLIGQGEAMKKVFPNFDLRQEMENPVFRRLTSPGVGISVEDAYHLVHRKELEIAAAQVVAQKTQEQITNSIRAGARRPDEGGSDGQSPSVTAVDWKHASPEERAEMRKQIRLAAAQGRKIYPGR